MSSEVEFLPAAVEIQETPASPLGRVIIGVIVSFFTLAVIWASLSPIDIIATAHGKIIPGGRVKLVQPMEMGVVRRIYAREGQRVREGDLLLELDPTANQADLGRLEQELSDAQLDALRFQRLQQMAASHLDGEAGMIDIQLEASGHDATRLSLQKQRLRSQWAEYQARVAAQKNTVLSREADLDVTRAQVKKTEATLPLITSRTNALKGLVAKKLSSKQSWLELEEQRVAQQQELVVLKNRVRQVAASIDEARQQLQSLQAGFRKDQLDQLAETRQRVKALQQETIKAARRTRLQRLTAPVNGVVQQLAVHTVGGVVTPAQELMKIVPESESLEVEAWILNKDIGFVREGQSAEVKIETFPFTRYGTIDATVTDVSSDAITDEQKGLVYAGRVMMKQASIRVGEKRVNLSPGMAVTVEVKTGTRRLIEFILALLLRYKAESMGER